MALERHPMVELLNLEPVQRASPRIADGPQNDTGLTSTQGSDQTGQDGRLAS